MDFWSSYLLFKSNHWRGGSLLFSWLFSILIWFVLWKVNEARLNETNQVPTNFLVLCFRLCWISASRLIISNYCRLFCWWQFLIIWLLLGSLISNRLYFFLLLLLSFFLNFERVFISSFAEKEKEKLIFIIHFWFFCFVLQMSFHFNFPFRRSHEEIFARFLGHFLITFGRIFQPFFVVLIISISLFFLLLLLLFYLIWLIKFKKNVLVWFILIGLISIASGSFFPGHLGINLSRWLCIQFHLIINFCFRYEYSAVCLHLS